MGTLDPLQFSGDKPPLALIAGPTASGKSGYAVRLAKDLQMRGRTAVVINADSAQMYADLHILSARPTAMEMNGVPHRLYGIWDGAEAGSAVQWAALAASEIAAVHAEGGVPILVGGTGLYLRTLLDGIAPIPPIDDVIRREVRALSQPEARSALEREDPVSAAHLAPADTARTQRALEVVRATGRSILTWRERKEGGIGSRVALDARVLLPEREQLYLRCDARLRAMIDKGALAEVERLRGRQLDLTLPVMRAIGVPELTAYLTGDLALEEAVASAQTATRQYAKRQYTWFSRQSASDWKQLQHAF